MSKKQTADVNDLGVAGFGVNDIGDAALGQALVTISSFAQAKKLAEDGLKQLEELVEKALVAQSKNEAALIWAEDICRDDELLSKLACCYQVNQANQVQGLAMKLRTRIAASPISEWLKIVKERGDALAVDRAKRQSVAEDDDTDFECRKVMRMLGVDDSVKLPPGYILTEKGVVYQMDEVTNQMVVIRETYFDFDTGIEYAEFIYKAEKKEVRSRIVRLSVLMSSRSLIELADDGLLVSSENAGKLSSYFRRLISLNKDNYSRKPISNRTGWVRMGLEWRFILPSRVVTRDGAFTITTPDDGAMPAVGIDGTWDAWKKQIDWVSKYPLAYVNLYVALAPTLLFPLKMEGMVYEHFGVSSTGKSTAMEVGASVWGKPTIGDGFLRTWNATQNAITASMVGGCDLPSIFDDAEALSTDQKKMLETVIYTVTQGEKMRSTKTGGLQRSGTIRTVMLTAGEASILNYGSKKTGAEARTLSNPMTPFGRTTKEAGQRIPRMKQILQMNYGHLGQRWLVHLVRAQEKWPHYRERLNALTELTMEQIRADDNGLMNRKAKSIALLRFTAELLHEEYRLLPPPKKDVLDAVTGVLATGESKSSSANASLLEVYNWCSARAHQFLRGSKYCDKAPHGGWLGRWDLPGEGEVSAGTPDLHIYPLVLRDILKEVDYEPHVVIGRWKAMGLLRSTKGRQNTVRMNGRPSTAYTLIGPAIDAALDGRTYTLPEEELTPVVPEKTPMPF